MWYTALLIGLTGSLHCAGMCSPLLMAVTNLTPSVVLNRIVYNTGRIVTYALLGIVFGSAGSMLPIGRYQGVMSIGFGIVLLMIALFRWRTLHLNFITNKLGWLTTRIKRKFSYFLQRRSYASLFAMGVLNGILPCGMTFLALTYCIILSPLQGANFMFFFGVGTLPVMLGLAPIVFWLTKKVNVSMQTATTGMIVISAIVLIARVFIHTDGMKTMVHNPGTVDIVICR